MRRELEALDNLPDERIDLSDIPELTDGELIGPHFVGLHYRPGKKSVTIRLDDDMLKWFRKQGRGWQTKMNLVLRLYFAKHRKVEPKAKRP